LFAKTRKPDVSLATVWNDGFPKLFLRQGLTNIARQEKIHIMRILHNLHLSSSLDSATWLKHLFRIYSVKSAYEFLNFRGIKLKKVETVWGLSLPLKIKLFFWLVIRDKALT
jgi:zinc-binding in reverse transcriptase